MTHRTPLVTEDHGTGAHILTDPTPHFMSHFASDRILRPGLRVYMPRVSQMYLKS
jgi:hypothetical protein